MTRPLIVLLGRKDEPTDAVEEYCRYLGSALKRHDYDIQIRRVPWEKFGWSEALKALQLQAAGWKDTWVLVQYTALAWSARGFPGNFLRALEILRAAGAWVAIVYHDVEPYPGSRLLDRLRRLVQRRTMRAALSAADVGIFTVDLDRISWLGKQKRNAQFIPVGANLPLDAASPMLPANSGSPTIGVFSITGGRDGERETRLILGAVRKAAEAIGKLRLSVFGRHAELQETALREGLLGIEVELSVEGVVEPEELVERLLSCDVLLFVRGTISTRRSSVIAGIACGLPVIAFSGSETAPPITEAGVILLSVDRSEDLGPTLVKILSETSFREDLANRSRVAYGKYFSWIAIAARYAEVLNSKLQ